MSSDIDYEVPANGEPFDETDVGVRAYFSRLSDEHLAKYRKSWSDEQVIEWDDNFRSDGSLMLVCCERDIEIEEYRRVLHEHLERRGIAEA